MTWLFFFIGLAGLFFGGDWLVRGASGVAQAFRVPPLVIGLVLVGFGTSTPELLVSLNAALAGQPGIAVGNVVGSCIANLMLILGVAAALGTIPAPFRNLARDLGWMVAAAAIPVLMFWDGTVSRVEGLALVGLLALYLVLALRRPGAVAAPDTDVPSLPRSALVAAAGLVAVLVGAHLLVGSASEIARAFGVSEAVIGLTVIAIGTSLPELATTIAAAMRGQRDIALGNVIGSNIFNVFGILGVTALVVPVPVAPRFLAADLPVLVFASLALFALVALAGRIPRAAGFAAIAAYAAYVAFGAAL